MNQLVKTLPEDTAIATGAFAQSMVVPIDNEPAPRLIVEPTYDALENRPATAPVITVPTITLEGDANGAPHPAPAAYAAKFSGEYVHRNLTGGVGHNLPQEAPQAFATAVMDADAL